MRQAYHFAEATVNRLDAGRVEIRWPAGDQPPPKAIYFKDRPARWEKAAGPDEITNGAVILAGIHPGHRHYFKIVADDGSCIIVSERRVQLEGAVNFRDLGGYLTRDGRWVRWGRVFRSDGLSRLEEADINFLSHLGVKHVFDFRSPSEVAAAPDRLPAAPPVEYANLPVTRGEFDFVRALKQIKAGDTSWLTPDFMVDGYISHLEVHGQTWGRVIRHLAGETAGATVFHCTGGKDRTGVCAALILLALGVPEQKVIEDHQLSNACIADILPRINEIITSYGVNPDILFPYLTAPREGIMAFLDYLNSYYRSVVDYLKEEAGVDAATLDRLRRNLLDVECP